jgi:homoserine kinase
MKLRLPATSANLGCGYDTLGLALSLYNTFEFWESETNICLDSDLDPADHLVFRAMQEAQRTLSFPQKNATLRVETGIPIKSGLGSSAACVAAGIMIAFLLQGKKIDKNQVLSIGTQIEGHPDNLAPLLYGGLTAALASETGVFAQAFPIDASIEPLIVVPRFSFSTEEARRALPEQIPVEDAVFNLTRIGLLIGALGEGNLDDIDTFTEDRLHEPYRLPLLRELDPNYRQNAPRLGGCHDTCPFETDPAVIGQKLFSYDVYDGAVSDCHGAYHVFFQRGYVRSKNPRHAHSGSHCRSGPNRCFGSDPANAANTGIAGRRYLFGRTGLHDYNPRRL